MQPPLFFYFWCNRLGTFYSGVDCILLLALECDTADKSDNSGNEYGDYDIFDVLAPRLAIFCLWCFDLWRWLIV